MNDDTPKPISNLADLTRHTAEQAQRDRRELARAVETVAPDARIRVARLLIYEGTPAMVEKAMQLRHVKGRFDQGISANRPADLSVIEAGLEAEVLDPGTVWPTMPTTRLRLDAAALEAIERPLPPLDVKE